MTSGERAYLDIGIFVKETNKSLNKMKQKINTAEQTFVLANLRPDSPDLKDIGLVYKEIYKLKRKGNPQRGRKERVCTEYLPPQCSNGSCKK